MIRMRVPQHLRTGDLLELVKHDASTGCACTQARMHAGTHASTYARRHARMHAHTHACMHAHTHAGWGVKNCQEEPDAMCKSKRVVLNNPMIIEGCCERMIEAARIAGAFVSSKIQRGTAAPLWIPGLIAVDAIEEGEVLIELPARLQLSPVTFERVIPGLFKAIRNIPASVLPGDPNDRALAASIACLLKSRFDSAMRSIVSWDPSFPENDPSILASVWEYIKVGLGSKGT